MIDNFALAISHGLMLLGAILLLRRVDLDREPSPHDRPPRVSRPGGTHEGTSGGTRGGETPGDA